jgi:hypothetical protein
LVLVLTHEVVFISYHLVEFRKTIWKAITLSQLVYLLLCSLRSISPPFLHFLGSVLSLRKSPVVKFAAHWLWIPLVSWKISIIVVRHVYELIVSILSFWRLNNCRNYLFLLSGTCLPHISQNRLWRKSLEFLPFPFINIVYVNNQVIGIDGCISSLLAFRRNWFHLSLWNLVQTWIDCEISSVLKLWSSYWFLNFLWTCEDHLRNNHRFNRMLFWFQTLAHLADLCVIIWTKTWISSSVQLLLNWSDWAIHKFFKDCVKFLTRHAKHWWVVLSHLQLCKFLNLWIHKLKHLKFIWMDLIALKF